MNAALRRLARTSKSQKMDLDVNICVEFTHERKQIIASESAVFILQTYNASGRIMRLDL